MLRRQVLFGMLAALATSAARAEHYLDSDEAARLLFPDADSFADAAASLSRADADRVRERGGMRVRQRDIRSIAARQGASTLGWVYTDDVIGKHEFITYAVAIDAAGTVRGVEILDYRETWGGAVREALWRAQFIGRCLAEPLRLTHEIENVSGATLSCRNVTDGVRRLLATHAVLGR